MTEQLKQTKDHRVRNGVGVIGAGALALAVAFGAGGAFSNRGEANADNTYSPKPTAGELGTPRPSEAAGTPEPTAESVDVQNFTVEKLGTFEVLPGDIISGDVSMSDTADSAIFPLYDQDTHKAADVEDNTKTALYVDVQVPGVVHAEWGATVTRGLTAEQKAEMLKLQAISKERAGFDKVDVVLWTGYDTTVDQAGVRSDNTEGSILDGNVDTDNPNLDNLDSLSKQDKLTLVLSIIAKHNEELTDEEQATLLAILVECLCGCEETPAESPTPSNTPEACPAPTFNDHLMKAGETYKVPAGVSFIAQGDVLIDGKKTYDSNEKTGAISVVTDEKANTIKAPWGADIQVFECPTDAFINETYGHDLDQLEATNRTLDKNSINQLK